MKWLVAVVLAAGCGRIEFAPFVSTDDAMTDAPPDGPPFDPAVCPATYTYSVPSTRSRYRIELFAVDWPTANVDCVDDQTLPDGFTHLAVIGDEAERIDVHALMNIDPWIGITDRVVEDTFIPVTLEDLGTYPDRGTTAWYPGEPNEQGAEDCLQFKLEGGFNDVGCITMHFYICECDAYPDAPSRY